MLTPLEIEALRLSESLHEFVKVAWSIIEPGTAFVDNWHIRAICAHLEAVTAGRIKRLVINVPFRTSKSSIVSVLWPAWVWTRDPSFQWLTGSHNIALALRDNVKMRRLVESPWFMQRWPGMRMRLDQNQKGRFENDAGGHRIAFGMTSGVTGEGGDALVIDDPHDRDSAHSDVERPAAITSFREKLCTRLNDPKTGAIVIIMQRLHELDLTGYVITQEKGLWVHLMIPMTFEPERACSTSIGWSDPRKLKGELMWPERFPAEIVSALSKALGSYGTAGQLQQRPDPEGGGLFEPRLIKILKALPTGIRWVRGWDFAGSDDRKADFTVGAKIGEDAQKNIYIGGVERLQGKPKQVDDLLVATASQDGMECPIDMPQDPGQAGKDSAGHRMRLVSGYVCSASPETGSKTDRARPFASQVGGGNVYMLEGPWNEEFLHELRSFPNGANDDQVDAASRAFNKLRGTTAHGLDYLRMLVAQQEAAKLEAAKKSGV